MRLFVPSLFTLLILTATAADHSKAGGKIAPTQLYIAAGTLISGSGAPIEVNALRASIQRGANKSGDDKQQQGSAEASVVTIASGTAFLSNDALGVLLNAKLSQRGLQDIKISNDNGQVKITGTAKKLISVPFTIEGPLTLTPQGSIRLATENVKVAKLPGLAKLLGINPKKMAGDGTVKGVQAQEDAIVFDPDLLWGLPVHGKVTRLDFQTSGLLLVFGGNKLDATKQSPGPSVRPAAK